ncbi:hypothetical protein T06_6926 [Trichinella sp. T6]|nr:hypothetical protein T06_6926 [Trichinella sp. T6]
MRNSKRTKEPGSNNVNGWLHAVNHRLGCRLVVCFLRLCTLKEPPLRQKFENSRAFRLILTELILRRLLLLLSEVDLQYLSRGFEKLHPIFNKNN